MAQKNFKKGQEKPDHGPLVRCPNTKKQKMYAYYATASQSLTDYVKESTS